MVSKQFERDFLNALSALSSSASLQQKVFTILDGNSLLKPKQICTLLKLNYKKYGATISSYKYRWRKSKLKDRVGLNRLSQHKVHFFGYALKDLDRRIEGITELAVSVGWILTKARNRYLLWKDSKLGRLEWFETGRINGYGSKQSNKGKLKQLLANAFYATNLVEDIMLFDRWCDTFTLKGSHIVIDTGVELPQITFSLLKDSHGIILSIGDKSHPRSVEVKHVLPEWAEKTNLLIDQNISTLKEFIKLMRGASTPKPSIDTEKGLVV